MKQNKAYMKAAALRKKMIAEFESYTKVKNILEKQWLRANDVEDVLMKTNRKISRRKMFYWIHKGMKISKTEKEKKRRWCKFSIVDLIGFAVLSDLRKHLLQVKGCEFLFDWLRKNITHNQLLVYALSEGVPVILFMFAETEPFCFVGDKKESKDRLIHDLMEIKNPMILVPLNDVYTTILKKMQGKNFHLEFMMNKYNKKKQIVYHINDERVILTMDSTIDFAHTYITLNPEEAKEYWKKPSAGEK